jgi:hypothetical protein
LNESLSWVAAIAHLAGSKGIKAIKVFLVQPDE